MPARAQPTAGRGDPGPLAGRAGGVRPVEVSQSVRVWSFLGTTAALQNAGDVPLVLPIWAGAGALLAYGLLLLGAGGARVSRADIS